VAKLTIWFGVALVVLGIAVFVATGSAHPTALIPAWFGVALAICGLLANTEDAKRRMLWMHIAVTIGLLGWLFPGMRAGMAIAREHASGVMMAQGERNAVHEELGMALICLVFTILCVRSFIAARRGRAA
jgi:hypothetical protein